MNIQVYCVTCGKRGERSDFVEKERAERKHGPAFDWYCKPCSDANDKKKESAAAVQATSVQGE
jgi:hypothetical protein